MFDPYRKWLGIPEDSRPPTHYQLLGISSDERDPEVIDAAVLRQSAYVRNFQTGKYADDATRVLNEIAAAKLCLLNPEKRAEYDAELKRRSRPAVQPAPAPSRPKPVAAGRSGATSIAPVKPAAPARPATPRPEIDLERLAGLPPVRSGLTNRSLYGGGQLLPTRRRQQTAAIYWLAPLIVGAAILLLVVVVTLVRNKQRPDVAAAFPPPQPVAGAPDANEPSAGDAPGGETTSSSLPGQGSGAAGGKGPSKKSYWQTDETDGSPFLTGSNSPSTATNPGARPPASGANRPLGGSPISNSATVPDEVNPFESTSASPASENDVDPSEELADQPSWGRDSKFSIPLVDSDTPVVFARGAAPFVAVAREVWNLDQGKVVGQTGSIRGENMTRLLSRDGKYYAIASTSFSAEAEVRSCETGQRMFTFPTKSFAQLKFIAFGEPDRLVTSVGMSGKQGVQIWNLPKSKLEKEFFTVDFDGKHAVLSSDGRYLAAGLRDGQIAIYDLRKSPDGKKRLKPSAASVPPLRPGSRFVDFDGLAFSPDGSELAAVTDRGARLVVLNVKTGEVVFEHDAAVEIDPFPKPGGLSDAPIVQWDPGGRGWLLGGRSFLDRKRRRVLWMLPMERNSGARLLFLDADHLLALRGDGFQQELVALTIPWSSLDASLAVLDAGKSGLLAAGQPVSLQVRLGTLLSAADKQRVQNDLFALVGDRLRAEGLRVLSGQTSVLVIEYSESNSGVTTTTSVAPGPTAPVGGFNQTPPPAAPIPSAGTGKLKLLLHLAGVPRPVWSTSVDLPAISAARSDDAAERKAVTERLRQIELPFFVPQDRAQISLPAIVRP